MLVSRASDRAPVVLPRLAPPPAPEPPPPPLLVTPAEAARMLSMSERWLWGATQRGEIPAVRLGRAVRYRVADLESYIRAAGAKS